MLTEKKLNKINWTLTAIMLAGLLIYQLVYFIIDIWMPWRGGITDQMFGIRFWSHTVVGVIQLLCQNLYLFGSVTMLIFFGKDHVEKLPYTKIILYVVAVSVSSVLMAGLFSLLDRNGTGNYFYPVWTVLISGAVVYILRTLWYAAGYFIYKRK